MKKRDAIMTILLIVLIIVILIEGIVADISSLEHLSPRLIILENILSVVVIINGIYEFYLWLKKKHKNNKST